MSAATSYEMADPRQQRAGLACTLVANIVWGVLTPLCFTALGDVPALEVLAHRVMWSALLLSGIYFVRRRGSAAAVGPRGLRIPSALVVTAFILGTNWLIYVHAVATCQMVQASLGYFLAPLLTVLLSVIFLRERLSAPQVVAVGLALLGALNLCLSVGALPWVALATCATFALYTLCRKKMALDAVTGLLGETVVLVVPAALILVHGNATGTQRFGSSWATTLLLVGSGGLTIAGLLAHTGAVRRLRLSTLGVLQYLAPSLNFLLAVFVYGESVSQPQLVTFALIGAAVLVYGMAGMARSFPRPGARISACQPASGVRGGLQSPAWLRRQGSPPVVSNRH
jgi:chloramphenicol-sensitive protein RarD